MAAEIRIKCEELTKSGKNAGKPCRNYAVVGSNPPMCSSHARAGQSPEMIANRRAVAKALFLEELNAHGDVNAAAAQTGYAYTTIRDWRYEDPQFLNDWEGVRLQNIERVEHSLFEQAVGVTTTSIVRERTPVEVEGEDGETVVEFEMKIIKKTETTSRSVQAAALWLRGNDPARYRDSKYVQPPEPRRVIDEKMLQAMMADPALSAAMDAIYDADLDD